MSFNIKLSEEVAILATIDPASVAIGTVLTAWVPMANIGMVSALIQTGALGASATIDAKFRQATDATGTGAKDVAGKAIAQIVKATGDNKQAFLEMRVEDLDVNNGYTFVALSVTVGTAASIMSASLLGSITRYLPASTYNQAAVAQIV